MNRMEQQLRNILISNFAVDERDIKNHSNFRDDLDISSLEMVEFLMAVEDDFNIEISDEDGRRIKTFSDMINFIKLSIEAEDLSKWYTSIPVNQGE